MFYYIVQSLKHQPCWLQRGLCTPLDALSYTSNALLVMAALGVLGGIFAISYAGDIESMASSITSITEFKRKYLGEKIELMSSDFTATHIVIMLSNYGNYPTVILGVVGHDGKFLDCISNNAVKKNFTISSGSLLEFSCVVDGTPDKTIPYFVLTDTRQIIQVDLQ